MVQLRFRKTPCDKVYTVSAKSIRIEKIFFKKTLFLKSKYYPEMSH